MHDSRGNAGLIIRDRDSYQRNPLRQCFENCILACVRDAERCPSQDLKLRGLRDDNRVGWYGTELRRIAAQRLQ